MDISILFILYYILANIVLGIDLRRVDRSLHVRPCLFYQTRHLVE